MALVNTQLIRIETQDDSRHRAALQTLAEQRGRGARFEEQLAGLPSSANLPIVKVYLRTYETADAAIAVACGSHALRLKFMEAIGLEDPGLETDDQGKWRAHYDEFAHRVERRIREKPCGEWMTLLSQAGIPVSPVNFPIEMFDDPQPRANGTFSTLDHPTVGPVQVPSSPVRLDERGFRSAPATVRFGSETELVLKELGFRQAAINDLIDAGVTLRTDQMLPTANPSQERRLPTSDPIPKRACGEWLENRGFADIQYRHKRETPRTRGEPAPAF